MPKGKKKLSWFAIGVIKCVFGREYELQRKEGRKPGTHVKDPLSSYWDAACQGKGSSTVDPSVWTAWRTENLPKHVLWESCPERCLDQPMKQVFSVRRSSRVALFEAVVLFFKRRSGGGMRRRDSLQSYQEVKQLLWGKKPNKQTLSMVSCGCFLRNCNSAEKHRCGHCESTSSLTSCDRLL